MWQLPKKITIFKTTPKKLYQDQYSHRETKDRTFPRLTSPLRRKAQDPCFPVLYRFNVWSHLDSSHAATKIPTERAWRHILRSSPLHDFVRVPAHGKPPFACASNLPFSLSFSPRYPKPEIALISYRVQL